MSRFSGMGRRGVLLVGALALAGPAVSAQSPDLMTRQKMIEYYQRFNAGDTRYADLLADDVVFPHPTGRTFHGRKEVVAFYEGMRNRGVRETREPTTIVVDNDDGLVAVELTVHIVSAPGQTATLPTGETVRPGDTYEGHNVVFYRIRDAKIVEIRGASTGPSKFVLVK